MITTTHLCPDEAAFYITTNGRGWKGDFISRIARAVGVSKAAHLCPYEVTFCVTTDERGWKGDLISRIARNAGVSGIDGLDTYFCSCKVTFCV